jgi:hypothetical protein
LKPIADGRILKVELPEVSVMAELPIIRTAIPKRRYQLGSYSVTVLGEIESGDGRDYRFIMAFVEQGRSIPSLFLCSERERDPGAGGSHRLRVVNNAMSEVLGSDDAWGDLDELCERGLELGREVLGLQGLGQPVRAM